MGAFKFVTVTLSLLLGLGVTRLLTSLVGIFQSRTRGRIHWIPLVWAAAVFTQQLQFWWAIIELEVLVKTWTLGMFSTLIVLPLLLFVSAALVIPQRLEVGESLEELFERDGRWGLLCLSAYDALAVFANARFFGETPFSLSGALLALEVSMPVVYLSASSPRIRSLVTVLYLLLDVAAACLLSPASY